MPLLFKRTDPLFGVWKMEEDSGRLLEMLSLKEEYRPFLEQVSAETRRRERLASRVLLSELLGREPRVGYHPSGAPFLLNAPFFVSFSHTKGYAAAIVGDKPVGIDIEYRSDRVLKVRSRFLTLAEEASIDPRHPAEHSLIYWCAKETLFKVLGQEEVDFREHLSVEPFMFDTTGQIQGHERRTPLNRSYVLSYRVEPEYILTWCEASD